MKTRNQPMIPVPTQTQLDAGTRTAADERAAAFHHLFGFITRAVKSL